MPIYDFSCPQCANVFEELQFGEELAPPCPKCGAQATVRLLSAPSPLKTGAFPFKPGPVHAAMRMGSTCGGGG